MRRSKVIAAAAVTLLVSAPIAARSASELPFTQQAFSAAQKSGKPAPEEIWASWCPSCAAQARNLSQIDTDPGFQELVIYNVKFDEQKDALRAMNVRMQSTLVVFHGNTEKGRSTGDIDAASIKALVAKAGQ